MGGSGKWVKSLIGLKKPEKEDCKVRENAIFISHLFWGYILFQDDSCL